MDGTIMCQGVFTANFAGRSNPNPGNATVDQANAQIIVIPSGVDWLKVYNYTASGRAGTNALISKEQTMLLLALNIIGKEAWQLAQA